MSIEVSADQIASLRAVLLDGSGAHPMHERFRALFTLKAVGTTNEAVVPILAEGLDQDPSDLLKHELAYVLGQIGDQRGVPVLENVLVNEQGKHGEMVRHEVRDGRERGQSAQSRLTRSPPSLRAGRRSARRLVLRIVAAAAPQIP